RNVVIDQDLAVGQSVSDARRARADGKMMDQDVRHVALLDQVAIVAGLIFEARICGLNEDVRFETGRTQHALNAQHFVADGIAIAEGGQHLVNLLLLQISTGPNGRSARTSFADRRSLRRLANQPGSGSMPLPWNPRASSSFTCARMSRYFCSITGHA